uniref:Uncharacterized protein n=1 Tax=Vespula pensylvanica TaxID=30213 RepID=A0A834NZF8_VESPE|nr:hypothetical protein H0235_009895 [Vespula pensylvanica]
MRKWVEKYMLEASDGDSDGSVVTLNQLGTTLLPIIRNHLPVEPSSMIRVTVYDPKQLHWLGLAGHAETSELVAQPRVRKYIAERCQRHPLRSQHREPWM